MKKLVLLTVLGCVVSRVQAKNPLFWGADPSGIEAQDGRVFVFPTYDLKDWSDQKFWECWSSTDLVNWTNHGKIFDAEMSGWGINNAWAPDITFKNGKYYFYYYFTYAKKWNHLVYYTGDNPKGPFTYRGEIMKPYGGNNHHSIIEYRASGSSSTTSGRQRRARPAAVASGPNGSSLTTMAQSNWWK